MSSNSSVTLSATLGNEVSAASALGLSAAQLTFDDEFNSFTASPDTTGWRTQLPYYGSAARTLPTGETDFYSDSSVGVDPFTDTNGVLTITSARTTPSSANNYQSWTSGLIQSQNLATQTYGYFETGINVTSAAGFWPSFWLTSVDANYLGEIDAAEILTGNGKQVYNTTHVMTSAGSKVATLTQVNLPTNLAQGFHSIGVDWEPDYVTWYIDGVASSRQLTAAYGLDQPMFMVLGQAVGGWAGTPAAGTASAAMNIDYVRSYATANTVSVAGSGVIKTASVTGLVQTADGAALADATVTVLDAANQVVATGTTNATGAFSVGGLAAGTYSLLYGAPSGYRLGAGTAADALTGRTASFTLGNGQTATASTETMAQGTAGSIVGSVVYKTNTWSTPPALSGVTVSLESNGVVVATTITDAAGRYQFSNVSDGTYQVLYTPQHYKQLASGGPADATSRLTAPVTVSGGSAVTLATETVIPATGSLTGTILFDLDGTGPGAATGLAGVVLTMTDYYGNLLGTATTGSNGAYTLTGIAPGYDYLNVTLPSGDIIMTGAVQTKVLIGSERATIQDAIVLKTNAPTGIISGTALISGIGDTGVTVAALTASGAVAGSAVTGTDGKFTIAGLAPGSYKLRYTAPTNQLLQSGPNGTSVAVTAGDTTAVANEVLTGLPGTISGTVLYAGAGKAGVVVTLLNAAGTATVATASTNAAGVFTFSNVTPASYRLSYAAPANTVLQSGPSGSTIAVSSGQTLAVAAEYLAPSPATITGTVTFAGAAQRDVLVTLLDSTGTTPVATATSQWNGSFSFTGIVPGTYTISYAAPVNEAIQAGPNGATVSVSAGQTLALAALALGAAPGSISGIALGAGGVPQAGVTVTLLDATGATAIATATSDASGAYSLTGIAPGAYRLSYAAPSGALLQSGPNGSLVTLSAGQALALQPEMLVSSAGTVNGTLLFAGTPVAGRTVALLNGSGATIVTSTTDTAGAYAFAGLADGTYGLKFTTLAGEALKVGDAANTATGIVSGITLSGGMGGALGAEHLLLAPVALSATANATLSRGAGNYAVTGTGSLNRAVVSLGDGTQSVTLTGWADKITLGQGNGTVTLTGNTMTVSTGDGVQAINAAGGYATIAIGNTSAGGLSTIKIGSAQNIVTAGSGNVSIDGAAASGSATLTLGNGNDIVTLGGSNNVLTVGTGASTLTVGSSTTYGNTVRAGGSGSAAGSTTVNILGKASTVDVGAGTTFINVTGGAGDKFMLNGAGQGLTTIKGYTANSGFTLDLTRTLAGTGIGTDLSQIATYVTATSVNNGADTLLSVDPTGAHGSGYGFLLLSGVKATGTMMADMLAKNDFALH